MPYSSMDEVNPAIRGIEPPVTLAQANWIADCADQVEARGEDVDPWAVCIAQFKDSHRVDDGHWVRREGEAAQMGEVVELAGFSQGRIISLQIMRPGTFQDMHGKGVTITAQDLRDYVANFEAGAAGQELPVFLGHPPPEIRPGEPAAAWYKRLYVQMVEGEERLFADLELSDIGQENLEARRYKYFSPTIDLAVKVIRGGGFVNLPAIKGLPAIELSQFLREAGVSIVEQVKQALREFFGRVEFAELVEEGDADVADFCPKGHEEHGRGSAGWPGGRSAWESYHRNWIQEESTQGLLSYHRRLHMIAANMGVKLA